MNLSKLGTKKALGILLFFLSLYFHFGISSPASSKLPAYVEYDSYGVPHISADDISDLFYTFGYVSARDRLFQMDVTRRKAKGTLSEIAGDSALGEDMLARSLNFYESARIDLDAVRKESPEAETILNAYSDGINAFVLENGLPPEYSILPPFEAWKPLDSMAIARIISFYLAENFRDELRKLEIKEKGGRHYENLLRTLALLSELPGFPILKGNSSEIGSSSFSESPEGSNAFVISGRLTESGCPILANDPHLEITFPPVWYEVWLTLENALSVRGACIPGTPAIVIGANENYAWGITALQGDNQDILVIDNSLLKEERSIARSSRLETFRVRDGLKVKEEKRTISCLNTSGIVAPVVSENDAKLVALRWVQNEVSLEALAFWQIAKGRNLHDFEVATSLIQTPLAFVFASTDGDIAFFARGLIPRRNYDGSKPQVITKKGQLADYLWSFYSTSELPKIINPPEGFIVCANNPPVVDDYGRSVIPGTFSDGTRARRIVGMISSFTSDGRKFSLDDALSIQTDVYSLYAEEVVPAFLSLMKASMENLPEKEVMVLDLIASWNKRMDADEPGALLWRLVNFKLNGIAMSKYLAEYATADMVRLALLGKGWFAFESDDLRSALTFAAENGFSKEGKPFKYGDKHKIRLVHPLPIYSLASPGDLPSSGGAETVDVSVGVFRDGVFYKNFGPTLRVVILLQDPLRNFYSVIPGGEAGNPSGPHFADQLALYLGGRYKYLETQARP